MTMTDTEHHINESADKIVLKTKLTRGEGTRDQDKMDVKVKSNDPEDAAAKLRATIDALEEKGVAQALRETQPGDNDE